MTPAVFCIIGWKNSGKTTLLCKLVEEFTARGFKVATVKSSHHDIQFEHPHSDSARHRLAGSVETAVISSSQWAIIGDKQQPSLEAVIKRLSPSDIVLVEGYKSSNYPKIECRRSAARDTNPMPEFASNIIAIATDHNADVLNTPNFNLNNTTEITNFMLDHMSRYQSVL